MQGRVKFVANKYREPGNTDEEIKKNELKRKRSEKKELKAQKAQAHALNIEYLINDVKLHASTSSSMNLQMPDHIDNVEDNDNGVEVYLLELYYIV